MTNLVGEFPELQGIAGYYYAQASDEAAETALAIKEHYLPRFSGDALPVSLTGCAVALADRIDTLIGIFGIGQIPTGDKDPFGLRRAALGVVRIIIERELPLDMLALMQQAYGQYAALPNQAAVDNVFDFTIERLRGWYIERGVAADVMQAVIATPGKKPAKLLDVHYRVQAVCHFLTLPDAAALAAANKRIRRILDKSAIDPSLLALQNINEALLQEETERVLYEKIKVLEVDRDSLFSNNISGTYDSYSALLTRLAELREPIDNFFEQVMVMADDPALRQNRVVLLCKLWVLFTQVADISLLS